MFSAPFDNLPRLTKKQALDILATPIQKLKLSSDYYKAVFHLAKYPSIETEQALLQLLESKDNQSAILIAKRKAIEVLARINCKKAIPVIKEFLKSDDPYLVENSAWALQELGLFDSKVNQYIGDLLNDPRQNLRVLIQSLSKMKAISELSKIKDLLKDKSLLPSIRGAAISAISNLSKSNDNIFQLKEYLSLPNQNDRQSAVQDIIDSNTISLLPAVIATPISPSFRIRAINILWPDEYKLNNKLSLFNLIELVLLDNPNNINLMNSVDLDMSIEGLIDKLFSTDFSECYLALKILKEKSFDKIWLAILNCWEAFEKDYGALYFLVLLLRNPQYSDEKNRYKILRLFLFCLSDRWPAYMKFRPAAIISLMKLDCQVFLQYVPKFLDEKQDRNWVSRYATLFSLEEIGLENLDKVYLDLIQSCISDSHRFVRFKAIDILSKMKYS